MSNKYTPHTLSDLLIESKDGDWGSDSPTAGFVPYHVIRGADFPAARIGDTSTIPIRYLSEQTAGRRTLRADDILIETAGGTKDRSTGRTLFVSGQLLDTLGGPATCASFARFLRIDRTKAHPNFIYWYLQHLHQVGGMWQHQVQHTGVARFQYTRFASKHEILLPSLREQTAIATVLQALDAKIAVNVRIADATRELGLARFHSAVHAQGSLKLRLTSIAEFHSRGVTPRYSDDSNQLMILNQKCIRGGRVTLGPSRRTVKEAVPMNKLLRPNDVLVNSTGVGTLGRVARWTFGQPCTVDSHVTIIRFDAVKVDPVCAGFSTLAAQSDIEALGEGSTGQTELSRARLGDVKLAIPSESTALRLRPVLDSLEGRGDAALTENDVLAKLRDTLLPKLISGDIRVRAAEQMVEDVT